MNDWSKQLGDAFQALDPAVPPSALLLNLWKIIQPWGLVDGIWLNCLPGHLQPIGTFLAGSCPPRAQEHAPSAERVGSVIESDGSFICLKQQRDGNVPIAIVQIGFRSDNGRECAILLTEAIGRYCLDRLRLQLASSELAEENALLRDSLTPRVLEHDIITISNVMETLIQSAVRAASSTATVLIQGETGTGKELFAKLIHSHSPRSGKPMVTVNAGALTPSLLESELFGHKKGAFTGADEDRKGLFEVANGGTLFLDEIGELTPGAQVRLLRVLQERTVTRVGDHQSIPIDVRIIAATHRNLQQEVTAGRFRQDLFYRLNVVNLHVPPLRSRKEDLPILINHFLQKANIAHFKSVDTIPEAVLDALCNYHWPGNVRELENCLQKMVVMSPGNVLPEELLPPSVRRPSKQAETATPQQSSDGINQDADPLTVLAQSLEHYADHNGPELASLMRQAEQILITYSLNKERGVKLRAAKHLGINRVTLDRKLHEYDITVRRGAIGVV